MERARSTVIDPKRKAHPTRFAKPRCGRVKHLTRVREEGRHALLLRLSWYAGRQPAALKPDASLRTASVGRPHRPYPSWGRPQGRDSEPSPGTDRYLNERKCHFYSARFSANRFSATLTKKEH